MQATPSRDTAPEKTLRRTLHKLGLRYRINAEPVKGLRCRADVVFRKSMVCVFIDGCFWHGCPKHFQPPKINTEWWLEKVEDNRRRDKRKTLMLKKHGWLVLRYWEHDINQGNTIKIAKKICQVVSKRAHKASVTSKR